MEFSYKISSKEIIIKITVDEVITILLSAEKLDKAINKIKSLFGGTVK